MKVIISPYSRRMRNGNRNPKNYPYFEEVVKQLRKQGVYVIQIGIKGEKELGANKTLFNKPLKELVALLNKCDKWISVDNFFSHLAYLHNKPGVVIFGQSDPEIFGHDFNTNLLKDKKYLRPLQFAPWEDVIYSTECFVDASVVINKIIGND